MNILWNVNILSQKKRSLGRCSHDPLDNNLKIVKIYQSTKIWRQIQRENVQQSLFLGYFLCLQSDFGAYAIQERLTGCLYAKLQDRWRCIVPGNCTCIVPGNCTCIVPGTIIMYLRYSDEASVLVRLYLRFNNEFPAGAFSPWGPGGSQRWWLDQK